MKSKINFLWHTALSMLDLGSSIIYNLLGRNLDACDIELIEKLLEHMSQLPVGRNDELLTEFVQFETEKSKKIIELVERLNKGKDILLITNKSNGYNLLQLSIINMFSYSFNLFDFDDQFIENILQQSHHGLFNARLDIVKALLAYGCDPNRGLFLNNKKQLFQLNEITMINAKENSGKINENEPYDSNQDETEQSENQTVITPVQTIVQNKNKTESSLFNSSSQTKIPLNTPVDTPLLLICCLYSYHNLLDYNKTYKTQYEHHHHTTSHASKMNSGSTPNTDLLTQNNSSSSSLSTCLSLDKKQLLLNKRRHTIHITKDCVVGRESESFGRCNSLGFKKRASICVNNEKLSEEKLDWPSRSIDRLSFTDSSLKSFHHSKNKPSSFSSSSSNSNDDLESDQCSTTTASSLFAESEHSSSSFSSSYFKEKDLRDYQTISQQKNDNNLNNSYNNNRNINSIKHYDSSEFSDYLEDENEEDDEETDYPKSTQNHDISSSNIYNYDFDHDDQNYFDKYEYDIDSKCCKLFSSDFDTVTGSVIHQQFNSISQTESNSNYENESYQPKIPSLSTSIFSIPSSSIQTVNLTRNNSIVDRPNNIDINKLSELARLHFKQRYIYEKLNNQRLELLDLVLEYGADKYLVANLSESNLKLLNKKTLNMLKKWFGVSNSFSENQNIESKKEYLKPLSPIMASICLDDVEVFSRLYKHHQVLFNYFKPDEDYELIYYAIRFQSKKCLIYLLNHSNVDETYNSNPAIRNSSSVPFSLNKTANLSHLQKPFDKINKNINTMFYILENTRSSKIISVLLKCGFDLCKREPFTGNTALHCLFNANSTNNRLDGLKSYGIESPITKNSEDIMNSLSRGHKILKEFNTPKSLSKIIFKLLKHGGLKAFVNTQNYENKVCMQVLFEWDELIETVFFESDNSAEWKYEFEESVRLLLKSGADLIDNETGINCIQTLIITILKIASDALVSSDKNNGEENKYSNIQKSRQMESKQIKECDKQTTSNKEMILTTSRSSQIFATAKNLLRNTANNMTPSVPSEENLKRIDTAKLKRPSQLTKKLDIKFLNHLFHNVIDLPNVISNLNRKRYYYYHQNNDENKSSQSDYVPADSLISKYLELLQKIYLDEFETAFKIFKMLCRLENQIIECSCLKVKVLNYVSPNHIKTLITNWILNPNLFSSSRQFDKNHFVKSVIVHLITNDMYDPNDCSTVYNSENCLISNNLLNHCVRLILKSKTGFQLELIYDLMRTLIQYGSNPNLEPYEFVENNFFNHFENETNKYVHNQFHTDTISLDCSNQYSRYHINQISKKFKSRCVLAQLCDCSALTPVLSPFNLKCMDHSGHSSSKKCQGTYKGFHKLLHCDSTNNCQQKINCNNLNQNRHHHHHHHHLSNYFDDYFNDKYFCSNKSSEYQNKYLQQVKWHELNHKNLKQSNLNPILLLTPSPSYDSLISLSSSPTNTATTSSTPLISNNIMIDKSVLFLNHYKKFVKLLYDSMDNNTIKQCLNHKKNQHRHHSSFRSNLHISKETHSLDSLPEPTKQKLDDHISSLKLYSIESLDMYLERLASTPRSLKSIVRRLILNKLIELQKSEKNHTEKNQELITIANQVSQLPLPKRIMDFLLFIE